MKIRGRQRWKQVGADDKIKKATTIKSREGDNEIKRRRRRNQNDYDNEIRRTTKSRGR